MYLIFIILGSFSDKRFPLMRRCQTTYLGSKLRKLQILPTRDLSKVSPLTFWNFPHFSSSSFADLCDKLAKLKWYFIFYWLKQNKSTIKEQLWDGLEEGTRTRNKEGFELMIISLFCCLTKTPFQSPEATSIHEVVLSLRNLCFCLLGFGFVLLFLCLFCSTTS